MKTADDPSDVIIMPGVGVLGAWVSDFLREAYRCCVTPTELHDGEADHVPGDIGRPEGAPRALIVERPVRAIMELLESRAVATVAVLDDPVDSVRFTMAARGWEFLYALRQQTGFAAAHHLFLNNPAVLLVERGSVKPARVVLATIMAHLGLRIRADDEASLIERFAGPEDQLLSLEEALATRVPHHLALDQIKSVFPAEDVAIVRQALSPLVLGAVSRDIGPVTWVARTLLLGDRPNEAAPPVVEITGGARLIFYGPYFHLPPGEWTVRMVLAFSPETRGMPFRLTLNALDRPIAKVAFKPEGGGAFEGSFTVRHTNPERFLEIHLMIDQGAIDGHIALGELTFTRTGWISAIDHRGTGVP